MNAYMDDDVDDDKDDDVTILAHLLTGQYQRWAFFSMFPAHLQSGFSPFNLFSTHLHCGFSPFNTILKAMSIY
jgi:hypothetical protein